MRLSLQRLGYELAVPPVKLSGCTRIHVDGEHSIEHILSFGLDAEDADDLRALLLQLGDIDAAELSLDHLVARLTDYIRWDRVWILEVEQLSASIEQEPEPETHDVDVQKHALHVELVYPNDEAAEGIEYVRVRPNGEEVAGKTGTDGVIEEDPAIRGIHTISLREVEGVSWQKRRMRVDETSTIEATLSGIDDGTKVQFKIYRQFVEQDNDAVDILDAEVSGDRARVRWKYEPAAISADHEAEQGVVRFVAEARVGDFWAKTLEPIEVELATVLDARWTTPVVPIGKPGELVVKTLGMRDGTAVSVKLFEVGHEVEDEKVADLSLEVRGGEARGRWTYPLESEEDAFWLSPECFFEATVAKRKVISDVIWFKRIENEV